MHSQCGDKCVSALTLGKELESKNELLLLLLFFFFNLVLMPKTKLSQEEHILHMEVVRVSPNLLKSEIAQEGEISTWRFQYMSHLDTTWKAWSTFRAAVVLPYDAQTLVPCHRW